MGSRSRFSAALLLLTTIVSARAGEAMCPCAGDCDADRQVEVSELVRSVRIAVGDDNIDICPVADADADGTVTVADLTRAVARSLDGCPHESAPACDCRGNAECVTAVCADGFCCDVRCPAGRCDLPGREGICTGLLTLASRCLDDRECQSEICDAREKICCSSKCTLIGASCFPSGHCRIR